MGMDNAKQLLDRLSHPDNPWQTVLILPVRRPGGHTSGGPGPRIDGYAARFGPPNGGKMFLHKGVADDFKGVCIG